MMIYTPIRDLAQLRREVMLSDSTTLAACRMREACGLGYLNAELLKRERPRRRKEKRDDARMWERMMHQRIGALDRP